MRATTQRMALLETLGKVKSVVPSRSVVPICSSILIRADGGVITLTGTDLEVSVSGNCKASISKAGAVCASPKQLESFLRGISAKTVTLSSVGKASLKVEADNATTVIEGFEAKEFPPVAGVKGKGLEVANLGKALKDTSYAMAKDDTRPVLNGLCFTPIDKGVELAAADGYRLAKTTVKAKGSLAGQVIIPSKAAQLLEKLMLGKVTIHPGQEDIAFVGDGLALVAKTIQGTYPNYNQVIPKNGSPLTVDRKQLQDALKVIMGMKDAHDRVFLRTRGKALIASRKDEEGGRTEFRVPAKGKVKIAFKGKQLKDLLARVDGQFTLRTTTSQSPGVVKNNGTIHVLMPLNIEW